MRDIANLKFYLDGDAQKELERLANDFPRELGRALQGVGFHMKRKIQTAIRSGGPQGRKWQKLSKIQKYQRLEYIRKAGADSAWARGLLSSFGKLRLKALRKGRGEGQYLPDVMNRWRTFTSRGGPPRGETSMGRMVGGIRYKMEESGMGVIIGGLNPSMDRFLRAVQAGGVLAGGGKALSSVGSLNITPKMRRLFYAAGIPLKKGRRTLSFPARPLIRPVFEQHANHIYRYILIAVKNYVEGGKLNRDAMAAQAGFNTSFY